MTLWVWIRNTLLGWSVPVQRLMQLMGKPEPLITDGQFLQITSQLRDGDVVLSRENWRFTSLFIPGFWTHAAIYVGGYVYEAVGDAEGGVRRVLAARWVAGKDHVALLRPSFSLTLSAVSQFLEAQLGAHYDYEFGAISGQKVWYCSELVYAALLVGDPGAPIELRETLGLPTVTPQDFRNMADGGKFILLVEAKN